jgi:hypothetical protein
MEIEAEGPEATEIETLEEGLVQVKAAAAQLQRSAASIETQLAAISGEVPKMVAAVETEPSTRLSEFETRLKAVEETVARQTVELRAQTAPQVAAGRKTLPVAATHLLAKQGIDTLDQVNGGALDAALAGLSLEQRIAVKSQLMRAGLLG